jgi:hypothetical protein
MQTINSLFTIIDKLHSHTLPSALPKNYWTDQCSNGCTRKLGRHRLMDVRPACVKMVGWWGEWVRWSLHALRVAEMVEVCCCRSVLAQKSLLAVAAITNINPPLKERKNRWYSQQHDMHMTHWHCIWKLSGKCIFFINMRMRLTLWCLYINQLCAVRSHPHWSVHASSLMHFVSS